MAALELLLLASHLLAAFLLLEAIASLLEAAPLREAASLLLASLLEAAPLHLEAIASLLLAFLLLEAAASLDLAASALQLHFCRDTGQI